MPAPATTRDVTRYILIAIALTATAVLLWQVSDALVIAFGGIVVATVLRALSVPIARWTGWRHRWALAAAIVLLLAVFGVLIALFGAQAAKQFAEFRERIPRAVETFIAWVEQSSMGRSLLETARKAAGDGKAFSGFGLAAGATLTGLGHLLLVVFLGVYFAADPPMYRNGALRLLPPGRRPQVKRALDDSAAALHKWLVAQLVIMVAVGLLTGVGLAFIGVPLALLLGIVAGLLEFVPVVGPIAAAIPGVLLAFAKGPETALYAILLYIVVQQVESNVITPVVQRWAVELPPVLVLLSIVVCGLLFGVAGVIFATPMAVVAVALVQHLYVEDTLEKGRNARPKP